MAENSAISWTDHSFAPWFGCAKVSPACDGCYAEHMTATRFGKVEWGAHADRSRSAASTWRQPLTWNRKAERTGDRPFVFCSHLSDVFDNAVPPDWRRDLFDLIRETPNLTWLLLTKRPGMIVRLFKDLQPFITEDGKDPADDLATRWPRNAAIGFTAVTQEEFDRDWPKAKVAFEILDAPFIFVSYEPAQGGLVLPPDFLALGPRAWVITGGETDQGAHKARPADPAWFRSLRDQCAAAGVPFHFKQWGEWQPVIDPPGNALGRNFSGGFVQRLGKAHDPCTLDGVRHDARPEVLA